MMGIEKRTLRSNALEDGGLMRKGNQWSLKLLLGGKCHLAISFHIKLSSHVVSWWIMLEFGSIFYNPTSCIKLRVILRGSLPQRPFRQGRAFAWGWKVCIKLAFFYKCTLWLLGGASNCFLLWKVFLTNCVVGGACVFFIKMLEVILRNRKLLQTIWEGSCKIIVVVMAKVEILF